MALQANHAITLDGILWCEFSRYLAFTRAKHASFERLELLENSKDFFHACRDILMRHRCLTSLGSNNF